MRKALLGALCAAAAMSSCIKEEAPNSECDIIGVTLTGDVLNRNPLIENDKVTLIVKNDVSVTALAPEFELTPGATIDPPSGTVRNFAFPQKYKVTSQDRLWSKEYVVMVEKNNMISLHYGFENIRTVSALGGACRYDVFYQTDAWGNESFEWASANAAFALSFQGSSPNTFPTYQGDEGYDGHCVVLVTRSTGSWGEKLGKPIASGNLFFGKFDMTDAVNHPLQATHFGTPFTRIPTMFSGYYKYAPGEKFYELGADKKLVEVPEKIDNFSLYAVLFETSEGHEWLDGENVLAADNPQIVCVADIPDRHPSDTWVEFSVPFHYRPGKSIDPDKLKNGKYSLAVVMGSSQDGDRFSGAIGSMLQVDELELTCAN